jgi:hypothetical protein
MLRFVGRAWRRLHLLLCLQYSIRYRHCARGISGHPDPKTQQPVLLLVEQGLFATPFHAFSVHECIHTQGRTLLIVSWRSVTLSIYTSSMYLYNERMGAARHT